MSAAGMCCVFLLVFCSGCVENEIVESTIIHVGCNGGFDFTSIQEAINASGEGYTIRVHEGIYHEAITINKSINLVGASAETTSIVNDNSSCFVTVSIQADSCTFTGFTVKGFDTSHDMIGISINSSHTLISDAVVMNAEKGIALERYVQNTTISDNDFIDNTYGIAVERSEFNSITNNRISLTESFSALQTYGIYLHLSDNTIISRNNISGYYRGIRIKGSDNSHVVDNILMSNDLGVWCCCGAGNNMIYHNCFINNELHARDDIVNNWDNGTVGNFWDDYQQKHPDARSEEGIWLESYSIFNYDDSYAKYDNFPLVDPIYL